MTVMTTTASGGYDLYTRRHERQVELPPKSPSRNKAEQIWLPLVHYGKIEHVPSGQQTMQRRSPYQQESAPVKKNCIHNYAPA